MMVGRLEMILSPIPKVHILLLFSATWFHLFLAASVDKSFFSTANVAPTATSCSSIVLHVARVLDDFVEVMINCSNEFEVVFFCVQLVQQILQLINVKSCARSCSSSKSLCLLLDSCGSNCFVSGSPESALSSVTSSFSAVSTRHTLTSGSKRSKW